MKFWNRCEGGSGCCFGEEGAEGAHTFIGEREGDLRSAKERASMHTDSWNHPITLAIAALFTSPIINSDPFPQPLRVKLLLDSVHCGY